MYSTAEMLAIVQDRIPGIPAEAQQMLAEAMAEFSAEVAGKERERCAKIVDNLARIFSAHYPDPKPEFNTAVAAFSLAHSLAETAADAIRDPVSNEARPMPQEIKKARLPSFTPPSQHIEARPMSASKKSQNRDPTMDFTPTNRGFMRGEFTDLNKVRCSLQESSIVHDEGVIWLGCNDIGLKRFEPYVGWSDVHLTDGGANGIQYTANTRMHLTQSMVKALLPSLQHFAETGSLPHSPEKQD
jgi:hypothetical protein